MTPDEFAAATGVSRETLARFEAYAELLAKWQRAVNLVGPSTLAEIWSRHFLDSAQLAPLLPGGDGSTVDLGSGAGFPGAVLALLGVRSIHLIEADGRKCAFLRELNGHLGLGMTIHERRIEQVAPWEAQSLTSRALAPLPKLLSLAEPFIGPATVAVFLKGEGASQELTGVQKEWKMDVECLRSRSSPGGVILRLTHMERKT
jgi:16S rRNA (guanine527-N7)-methyltransferase